MTKNMRKDRARYIPARSFDWLTPLYDPFIRWTTREMTFKPHLVRRARIEPGHRVLDLGCGTATLTILAKQAHPDADVASDTIGGLLPGMFLGAGFEQVEESARYRTVFGTLTLYRARKPG